MLRTFIVALVFVSALFVGQQSSADFEDGRRAYFLRDYDRAIQEWEPLARSNDLRAMVYLGKMHFWGDGFERNLPEAQRIFEHAAALGSLDAINMLARLKFVIGRTYEAAMLWRKAAKKGHAESQSALASALANGHGVHVRTEEAFRWRLAAARQGHAMSQRNVAIAYRDGKIVPRNLIEAYKWLSIEMDNVGELKRHSTYLLREKLAEEMSPSDLVVARRAVLEWLEIHGNVDRIPIVNSGTRRLFDREKITEIEWQEALLEARLLPGSSIVPFFTPEYAVQSPSERAFYMFTSPGHRAHPALIVWRVVYQDEQLGVELEGHFAGNEKQYRKWLAENHAALEAGKRLVLRW